MTIINEHMTWEQIVEKYPDKWVGLTDIVWENESNVESAVLFAVSTNAEELMSMQIDKKNLPRSRKVLLRGFSLRK